MNDRQGDISVKLVEHVACLQIDRPPYNHVSVELMRDLADLLHAADAEKEVRAILLTSRQKLLCRRGSHGSVARRKSEHGYRPAL